MPEQKFNQPGAGRKDYLSWNEAFIQIAYLIAQRSKDPHTQTGACIVDDSNIIVGLGYNGFPRGCSDSELPWSREGSFVNKKYAYVVHAEANAIFNSNKPTIGCKMYCVLFPCNECAKIIIQNGIKEVIYAEDKYHDDEVWVASRRMLDLAGVKYCQYQPKYKLRLGAISQINDDFLIRDKNKIVAVVGMPGSGKTEVTKYIEGKGCKKVYFGQVTFDEIKRRGLETNEANEKSVREDLRRQYGMAAYAILNIPKIRGYYDVGEDVVIESLYSWQEYLKIKQEFGNNFYVIAVSAPPRIRYDRVVGRVESKNNVARRFTQQEIESRDKAQIEHLATAGPIAMADFTIINDGTMEELHRKIDSIIQQIFSRFNLF